MGTETRFINIQAELCRSKAGGEPEAMMYGRSPIRFQDGRTQKSTRKVIELLRGSLRARVLDPRLEELNEAIMVDPQDKNAPPVDSLTHEFTGAAFVNTAVGPDVRLFTNARVIVQGNSGKYDWGIGSNIPDRPKMVVVSGPCLFSAPGVQAIDSEGQAHALTDPTANEDLPKIESIKVTPKLQPYEIDSIIRQSRLIGGLNDEKETTVALNLPRLEYWLYALDAFGQGLIDPEVMTTWFDQVNERAQKVETLIRKRLPGDFQVISREALSPGEALIRKAVAQGDHQLFKPLVDALASNSPLWKYAIEQTHPTRFADIGYLSYTIPYLENAASPDTLLVAVENPEETKILDNVLKLLPRFNDVAILGLYPHSNAILREDPPHGMGKRFLYFFEPNGSLSESVREIVRINQ